MAQNNPDEQFQEKIDRAFPASGRFPFMQPNEDMIRLTLATRELAMTMKAVIPHTRERSLAFSRLEECFIWSLLGLMRK